MTGSPLSSRFSRRRGGLAVFLLGLGLRRLPRAAAQLIQVLAAVPAAVPGAGARLYGSAIPGKASTNLAVDQVLGLFSP